MFLVLWGLLHGFFFFGLVALLPFFGSVRLGLVRLWFGFVGLAINTGFLRFGLFWMHGGDFALCILVLCIVALAALLFAVLCFSSLLLFSLLAALLLDGYS